MAEAIVGPLLSKLQEVAVTEAKALAGVGGQIDSLRDKLMWLHALLHEIEQRSRHDTSRFRRVLSWQIREVALQAEDAIDQFYLEADLSRRGWRRAATELFINFRTQVRVRFVLPQDPVLERAARGDHRQQRQVRSGLHRSGQQPRRRQELEAVFQRSTYSAPMELVNTYSIVYLALQKINQYQI